MADETRTLIRAGTVLSMDPAVGDLRPGSVLVEGTRITAVGAVVEAPRNTTVIDAPAGILVPGLVDTHRHMWEALLRGIAPHHTLGEYLTDVLGRLGPALGPDDLYLGTLLSARAALLSGTTTAQDISNIHESPETADAVVAAHESSGLRTVFAYGKSYPAARREGGAIGDDVKRLADELDGGLVTLALDAEGGDDDVERHNAALARELGLRVARHFSAAQGSARRLKDLQALLPGTTFIHANGLSDAELDLIAESGGSISVSPAIELVMGHGYPMMAARSRVPLSLSTDVEVTVPADLFTQMRAALAAGRNTEHPNAELTAEDVLRMATLGGAETLGLGAITGSITPGKRADLLLLDAGRSDVAPVIDPYSTVVLQMDRAHVDTVWVDGEPQVRHGRPVVDEAPLLEQAAGAVDRLRGEGFLP
jgi:5-methylthioadenosine/S-adenosylhomocysteine deaminase